MPRQALAKHDLPRVIHPHRVQHVLCEIDPEDGHLLLHGTHLLWLNGFPNLLELIVAHCRRSAQGRVHFITTEQGNARCQAAITVLYSHPQTAIREVISTMRLEGKV